MQTHISTVFLTERYVFKFKRPVDVGFADFRTLRRRRHFCNEEVRLNRRLRRDDGGEAAYEEPPVDDLRAMAEDVALLYPWFDGFGYSVDIAGLRRDYPEVGWMFFEDWAKVQYWHLILSSFDHRKRSPQCRNLFVLS